MCLIHLVNSNILEVEEVLLIQNNKVKIKYILALRLLKERISNLIRVTYIPNKSDINITLALRNQLL